MQSIFIHAVFGHSNLFVEYPVSIQLPLAGYLPRQKSIMNISRSLKEPYHGLPILENCA